MTLRFAAARRPDRSPVARVLARRANCRGANDNGGELPPDNASEHELLAEALRHFAAHGLGAARAAKAEAERARERGDEEGFDHWLGICRLLDRRMAGQLARRHAPLLGQPTPE